MRSLNVLLAHGFVAWVVQGIEIDVCTQGATPEKAIENLLKMIAEQDVLHKMFPDEGGWETWKRAPDVVSRAFDRAKEIPDGILPAKVIRILEFEITIKVIAGDLQRLIKEGSKTDNADKGKANDEESGNAEEAGS